MSRILGIGLDVVELDRIARVLSRHGERFRERVFTPAEIAYCDSSKRPVESYAARWAAKEAVSKALGTGIGEHCAFLDVEVLRAESGAPSVRLLDAGSRTAMGQGVAQVLVSLTHARDYAAAQAIAVG